jgi:uncharacterized protein (DUF608 family)
MKRLFILFFVFPCCLFGKTDGTTGLPLGGIGTGAVKFNAVAGTFSANFSTPTRNGDYQQWANAQFQLFTKRGSSIITSARLAAQRISDRVDDDAVFPLHRVNFGETNGVSISMTAYLPFDPQSIPSMCHPCAMFEFSLRNTENDAVTAALALQIPTSAVPKALTDTGFADLVSGKQLCLMGSIPDGTGEFSIGDDNGFFTTGLCDNRLSGSVNRLAIRVSLQPAETQILRFVLAWYRADDKMHYRYTQFWDDAGQAAASAFGQFSLFKTTAETWVTRIRASNLPEWLTDQTLNSLVNLVNNSVSFQDGRYCHTEGQWYPEGTMDQMWHARQIYTMVNPDLAWQELEWWARTQHAVQFTGQIHHDFGTSFNYIGWDDTEHPDYRPIEAWVDLNCGFVISVYEAFIATDDQARLSFFWPYLKKAGQRILDQVVLYESPYYPFTFSTSLSSYDAGGNSQAYNTGLSIVAYRILMDLAEVMNEPQTVDLYRHAFEEAVDQFQARWLDKDYPTGSYCESVLGGPWIADFLKMDPIWDRTKLDNLFMTLLAYYDPINNGMGLTNGSYSEWQPYLIGHLGGYALETNRPKFWLALQYDMYERNYNNRNLVFNEQLGIPAKVSTPIWTATSAQGSNQYISIPVLWRNYYDLVGFHRNKHSGELWLEPVLWDSLGHRLDNAFVVTPEGNATISYLTYGDSHQNQEIVFKPDNPMTVSALYVWDLYADSLNAVKTVRVNGAATNFWRTGGGDQSHLKLNWAGTIPPGGVSIQIEGVPKSAEAELNPPVHLQGVALGPSQIRLIWSPGYGKVAGYHVESKLDGTWRLVGTTGDTSFVDTGLLKSTSYVYRVRAYDMQTISEPSSETGAATEDGGNGEVVLALNAGGDAYQSAGGIRYLSDATSGWVSGGMQYWTNDAIIGTPDQALYQTERYGNFSYAIPLANGMYDIVLKFAEIDYTTSGARVFNVFAAGNCVISNLDLFLRAGKDRAYDVVVPVEVTEGFLYIAFFSVVDNAKLSALEVRKQAGTSVQDGGAKGIASVFSLDQNHPNPFNGSTQIRYGLPRDSRVCIAVYNALGEHLLELVDAWQKAGYHEVTWNADRFASGVYFCRIQAGDYRAVKKMMLVR